MDIEFDAIGDGQPGLDCFGHGTHCAGTVGGKTVGVAKNVILHSGVCLAHLFFCFCSCLINAKAQNARIYNLDGIAVV